MSKDEICVELRRFEKLEERINQAERDLSTIENELGNTNEHIDRIRTDLRERIDAIREELKDTRNTMSDDLSQLNENIIAVNESVQQLFISQSSTKIKVSFNEKIIWGVVTLVAAVGLYYVQAVLKLGGGG